jgi:hypothetical protein
VKYGLKIEHLSKGVNYIRRVCFVTKLYAGGEDEKDSGL